MKTNCLKETMQGVKLNISEEARRTGKCTGKIKQSTGKSGQKRERGNSKYMRDVWEERIIVSKRPWQFIVF